MKENLSKILQTFFGVFLANNLNRLINCIVYYAVSTTFQLYDGGKLHKKDNVNIYHKFVGSYFMVYTDFLYVVFKTRKKKICLEIKITIDAFDVY